MGCISWSKISLNKLMGIILKGSENKLQNINCRCKIRSVYSSFESDENISQTVRT